jgi:hypothetical protein
LHLPLLGLPLAQTLHLPLASQVCKAGTGVAVGLGRVILTPSSNASGCAGRSSGCAARQGGGSDEGLELAGALAAALDQAGPGKHWQAAEPHHATGGARLAAACGQKVR